MYVHAIVAFTALRLLIFAVSTPLPDVRGNVQPPVSGDLSSLGTSSSSTWTPQTVYVGNSILLKGQDGDQPPLLNGQSTQRSPNDLFGSVDSSTEHTDPSLSNDEGNELQRQEQEVVRRPPTGGYRERRQTHDLFGSVDSSLGATHSTLSESEGNQLQRQEQEAVRQPPSGGN